MLLAGTTLSSGISGYLLTTYESQELRSASGMKEIHPSGPDKLQSTANNFHEVIEELKATVPEPGAVFDHPEVLESYGFSGDAYLPGKPCFFLDIDSC